MKILKLLLFVVLIVGFSSTDGKSQNALSFDGIDDFVNCGNGASQNIMGPITLEVWIYRTGDTFLYDRIMGREWVNSYSLGCGSGFNKILFGMDPKGNLSNMLESPGTIPLNVWTHVAGTWDGADLKLYFNGELIASKPYTNASVTGSTVPTYIGKRFITSTSASNYKSDIDEVRIWNVARTQQEIKDNMHREILNPATVANLVGYYQFNEGSGQTTADLSFNTNDGFLGLDINAGSDDPTWITSTAPLPFYSVADGNWNSNATWANGQNAPTLGWAVAEINNNVTVNSNEIAKDVTVNTTGQLTVLSANTFDVSGQFIIRSDGSGTGSFIDMGAFTAGNSIVERYYTGGEWHLISSPVQNAVSGMFTGLYLQSFDEATNSYSDIIPTTTPLMPGYGYAIWNNNNATATYSGTLNTGSIGGAGNISRTGAGSASFGWNLMGNPYPSSLDWDAASGWTKTNIDNATYRHVNAATWATYVGGVGTNGGSQFIAPGQGFFVSATDNGGPYPESGTLMSDNNTRVHNNVAFFKDEITDLARLQISGNGYTDETVIRFTENATTGFDSDWDAHKLFGYQAEAAQIYSHLDQDYSINALPEVQAVSVGVKATQSGTFTIEATDVSDFQTLILEDILTGETTDLLQSIYAFEYIPEIMDERFILHFSPMTGINDKDAQQAHVFATNGNLVVSIPGNQNGAVSIFSLNGQLVKTVNVSGSLNTINMDQNGAYVVKIVTDGFVVSQKININ